MNFADIIFDRRVSDSDLQRAYAHALALDSAAVRVIRKPDDLPLLGAAEVLVTAVALCGDCKLRASIAYVPDGKDVSDEALGLALAEALGCGVYVPSDDMEFWKFSRFRPGMRSDSVSIDLGDEPIGEEIATVSPYVSRDERLS